MTRAVTSAAESQTVSGKAVWFNPALTSKRQRRLKGGSISSASASDLARLSSPPPPPPTIISSSGKLLRCFSQLGCEKQPGLPARPRSPAAFTSPVFSPVGKRCPLWTFESFGVSQGGTNTSASTWRVAGRGREKLVLERARYRIVSSNVALSVSTRFWRTPPPSAGVPGLLTF